MKTMSSKIKTIQELDKHEHTCLIYSTNLEFMHCLIPFVREGLKKNERCLIVLDEIKREDIIRGFKHIYREGPIPAEDLSPTGRISIELFKNIYLKNGSFSMEETMKHYINSTKKAIDDGYTGFRVFAEISNSAKDIIGTTEFLKWEEYADKCLKQIKGENFQAVCAYNKKYFNDERIEQIIKSHPVQIDLLGTRL